MNSSNWTAWLPLAGVVVGWLLSEFAGARNRRREDRRPVGRALAHLLQLHWFLHLYSTFGALKTKGGTPLEEKILRQFKFSIPDGLPAPEEFAKSYAAALEKLAEISPMLAFELQGKDHVRTLYAQIKSKASETNSPEGEFAEVIGDITAPRALKSFEGLILELAKDFSRREYHRVRYHFRTLEERRAAAPEMYAKQKHATAAAIGVGVEAHKQ